MAGFILKTITQFDYITLITCSPVTKTVFARHCAGHGGVFCFTLEPDRIVIDCSDAREQAMLDRMLDTAPSNALLFKAHLNLFVSLFPDLREQLKAKAHALDEDHGEAIKLPDGLFLDDDADPARAFDHYNSILSDLIAKDAKAFAPSQVGVSGPRAIMNFARFIKDRFDNLSVQVSNEVEKPDD